MHDMKEFAKPEITSYEREEIAIPVASMFIIGSDPD